MKDRDYLEDEVIDMRIMLNWVSEKENGRAWTE
jgi:hypothetical protein